MAFVMPAKMKAGDISKPLDSALKVRELPGGRFAVLRYSGERSAKNETESLERLRLDEGGKPERNLAAGLRLF